MGRTLFFYLFRINRTTGTCAARSQVLPALREVVGEEQQKQWFPLRILKHTNQIYILLSQQFNLSVII